MGFGPATSPEWPNTHRRYTVLLIKEQCYWGTFYKNYLANENVCWKNCSHQWVHIDAPFFGHRHWRGYTCTLSFYSVLLSIWNNTKCSDEFQTSISRVFLQSWKVRDIEVYLYVIILLWRLFPKINECTEYVTFILLHVIWYKEQCPICFGTTSQSNVLCEYTDHVTAMSTHFQRRSADNCRRNMAFWSTLCRGTFPLIYINDQKIKPAHLFRVGAVS